LTSIIIVLGLLFMFVTGYYILNGVEHGSSKDMAIDQRIDQCYEEKGLD
jgi:hypothetical protein